MSTQSGLRTLMKITVHTPSYNEAQIMPGFVDNFKNQTHQNISLVLHDDSSTDGTPLKFVEAAETAGLDHSVRTNPTNIGLVRNFRKIFQSAPALSSHFLFASNHERYATDHIESLLTGANFENTVLTYSDSYLKCDKTGDSIDGFQAPDIDTCGLDRVESFAKVMQNYSYANPLWGLYNSNLCCMASPFPFGRGGDHAFIAGIALTGNIKFIRKKTWTRYRNQNRTPLDFARAESQTRDEIEIQELSKWQWLSFWNAHYEVISNSAISNTEKQKCIGISINICNQRSNGVLFAEMERVLSTKKGPVNILLNALTLNSLLKL